MKSKKITILDGIGTLGADRTVTVAHADGSTSTITGTNVVLAAGIGAAHHPRLRGRLVRS